MSSANPEVQAPKFRNNNNGSGYTLQARERLDGAVSGGVPFAQKSRDAEDAQPSCHTLKNKSVDFSSLGTYQQEQSSV